MLLRVLGTVNQYRDNVDIVIDHFEVVNSFNKEIIFHKSLKVNQLSLNNNKILEVLSSINNFDNINEGLNNITKKKKKRMPFNEKQKIYSHHRKNFANRILGFIKKFKFEDEIKGDLGYIILNEDSLLNNEEFNKMKKEFCSDNNITNEDKFLMESLSFIEENSMGKIDHDNKLIEIKLNEINDLVIKMLKDNSEGLSYTDIFDNISRIYNNFFMDDYIKFIIEDLSENGKIQQNLPNHYQILI